MPRELAAAALPIESRVRSNSTREWIAREIENKTLNLKQTLLLAGQLLESVNPLS